MATNGPTTETNDPKQITYKTVLSNAIKGFNDIQNMMDFIRLNYV